MTQAPEGSGVQDLQPVTFTLIKDDGVLAVYQALIEARNDPGTVFSLTATTASPGAGPAGTALLQCLDEIRAAFTVLDQPGPADPVEQKPAPFDPVAEVQIEPGLARTDRDRPVYAALTAQATAGTPTTLRYKKRQRWKSSGGKSWATVRVQGGNGTIRPPACWVSPRRAGTTSTVASPDTYETYSDTVTLSGTSAMMLYILYGNFVFL
jgi:hypothetical protein